MNITEQSLKDRGWTMDPVIEKFLEECKSSTVDPDIYETIYFAPERDYNNHRRMYMVDIRSMSNTPDCWSVHVDNDFAETIATADVKTFEQIEDLLQILDKNYE